jgi:hypothetical protein
LDDLCRLTVGWLTGEIGWQPGYYGPVDVDEDQAPGLTAALISLNAAGVCTRNSQAGYVGTGADGAVWVQHAAVTGYADTQAWYRLLQAMDGTRYQVLAHTVRPRLHRARPGVVVTWRDGQPHTGFGGQLGAGQVRADLDGAGRPAVTEAVRALQVTVWDPTPGANTLWEHLVGISGTASTRLPDPEPVTDLTVRPVSADVAAVDQVAEGLPVQSTTVQRGQDALNVVDLASGVTVRQLIAGFVADIAAMGCSGGLTLPGLMAVLRALDVDIDTVHAERLLAFLNARQAEVERVEGQRLTAEVTR